MRKKLSLLPSSIGHLELLVSEVGFDDRNRAPVLFKDPEEHLSVLLSRNIFVLDNICLLSLAFIKTLVDINPKEVA